VAVAALGAVAARLRGHFFPGHAQQQFQQVVGAVQLVLPCGGAEEEAGQDRLADVGGVEHAVEVRIVESPPHLDADDRLELPDQLDRGLGLTGPDAAEQVVK
jgi:hypothetical protein